MGPLAPRPSLATVWLGGCSGCHMSVLDMDERLLDVLARADLVYSPFIDVKTFPAHVDITLVEGAIANDDHVRQIQMIRERTDVLVALGDCAVTGNVTALRNPFKTAAAVLHRAYGPPPDLARATTAPPGTLSEVPPLLDKVRTTRGCVRVDVYVPGCPPPADIIYDVLRDLIGGHADRPTNRARLG